jgi:hydroxypyruvate reductase
MTALDLRSAARRLREAALAAVDPALAVRRAVRVEDGRLEVWGRSYDLASFSRLWLLGAGKASVPMAAAVAELLGERLAGGLVVTKEGHAVAPVGEHVRVLEAGHPLPDARSLAAGRAVAAFFGSVSPQDLVIFVLSGGASALLALPAGDLSLEELRATTDVLLRSGATIDELNTVRKHLDALKGGGLARLAPGATLVTLALSDVGGDEPSAIGSGPSVADPTTFADALAVLERHGVRESVPPRVVERFEHGRAGTLSETPKPGDAVFEHGAYGIVGSNRLAAEAAELTARELGFHSLILTTRLEGEAREAARVVAALVREISEHGRPVSRPGCLVLGGETTVTVRGRGLGGRNQELALAAALALEGVPNVLVSAFGTDGTDGPTDAAGAVATGESVARGRELGVDAASRLADNDAYRFFAPLGDLIMTGPTGTNVCDLVFALVG